jgi:VanZ family protein
MEQKNAASLQAPRTRDWSNRILAASLFGIFFFTLFPYWIDLTAKHALGRSPFLLGGPLKFDGILHTFLNALLFAPFGFALSQFFGGRRKSFVRSIAIAVVAGAVLSYSIEVLQLYIPSRDSAWDDVLANTVGALAGMIFGLVAGDFVFRKLSEWECHLERFLTLRKIMVVALIYFSVWLAISIPLQQKSRLSNWDPNSFLIVAYDINDNTRWPGAVSRVQIWHRAFTVEQATELSGNVGSGDKLAAEPNSGALASYDISQPAPIANKAGVLPNLALRPLATIPDISHQRQSSGSSPILMSETALSPLSDAFRSFNSFTVLIDCLPHGGNSTVGAIFDITNLSGNADFYLQQDHSSLIVFVRNGLYSTRSQLWWAVPDVFTRNARRSIVFSYDGARASLYIDGKAIRQSPYFSPGAALVSTLIRIKTSELVAYSVLYESLVFLPIGFLAGIAVRIIPRNGNFSTLCILLSMIFPAIILEALLVWISGRHVSIVQLIWSIVLTVAGMLWMNLDSSETL